MIPVLPEAVMFHFDDIFASIYERAYPILAAEGFPATAYCIQSHVGDGAYCTLAQYQELYADGWDVGNHTVNHAHLDTLTEAQQEAEIGNCAAYLTTNGMPRAAKHVAYPFGGYNEDTLTAMAATGMETGRRVSAGQMTVPIGNPYLLVGTVALYSSTMPLANAKAALHSTTPGRIVTYLCHDIDTDGGSGAFREADFAALVAYVKAQGCRVVTISQLYDYIQAGYVWPE